MDLDDDAQRAGAPSAAAPGEAAPPPAGEQTLEARGRHGRPPEPLSRGAAKPSIRTSVVHDDRVVVHLVGALDLYTVGVLREVLLDVIAAEFTDIVVVLTGVTFVDSTGLGVLVGAHKRLRSRGGRLQLVVDQESVLKVIRITALNHVFTLYPTLDAALAG